MKQNLHSNHRERVRNEFLKNGFDDSTPPHKILEMLLFYSIPRKDTNKLAHELINRFGSLSGVFDASSSQLLNVPGLGENSVALIRLIPQIFRSYCNDKVEAPIVFKNISEIGNFLVTKYFTFTEEVFAVTSLTRSGKFISFDILERGDIESVGISMRKLIETVIEKKARCIVISHNHPSSIALPSNEDIALTERISQAVESIGVTLIDHLIITCDDYVSLAQSKQYCYLFGR